MNWTKSDRIKKIENKKNTLGPAGPPLQRGVLEVPQSAQTFLVSMLWFGLPFGEIHSGDFLVWSSELDPCRKKKKELK